VKAGERVLWTERQDRDLFGNPVTPECREGVVASVRGSFILVRLDGDIMLTALPEAELTPVVDDA
jgi:hypothetical protein